MRKSATATIKIRSPWGSWRIAALCQRIAAAFGGGDPGGKPRRDARAVLENGQAVGWCRVRGLNSRPTVYKTAALPLS
jgi:hypothetical protein